jgi:hypothetical protein
VTKCLMATSSPVNTTLVFEQITGVGGDEVVTKCRQNVTKCLQDFVTEKPVFSVKNGER